MTTPDVALMYHDVVGRLDADDSGFPGRDAARYKVAPELFESHLAAIAAAPNAAITFDDGGISALRAADALERYGLTGYFFVTCNYIGSPGFVDRGHIRELAARGHTVGSHSCSHPLRMGHCSRQQLVDEWTRSRAVLESIVGDSIRVGSVPGGDFAPSVAETAGDAGFTLLFTSEPTRTPQRIGPVTLVGRYTIQATTPAATVAGLVRGAWLPHAQQAVWWTARKVTKRIAGSGYLKLRKLLLRHGDHVQWGDMRL